MMTSLDGKRILLVEDEFLIAARVEEMLVELGAVVIGPAGRMSDGLALAEQEALDAAVLDININGEPIAAIADVLRSRNIPFILATGYGEGALGMGEAPRISKPYSKATLGAALLRILDDPSAPKATKHYTGR